MSVTDTPVLHAPDEPTALAEVWLTQVLEGTDLESVLTGDGGVVDWLWSRWRSLGSAGFGRDDLVRVVSDYQREIWLWLAGERTWGHCCSGLIGRIGRRIEQPEG